MKPASPRRLLATAVALTLALNTFPKATAQAASGGSKAITAADLKAWLTTISSDEFEGRATFSEGLGLAAGYIAGELRAMGVKPGGDKGSYFQRVAVLGIKSTSRHTLSVTVNGETRTFKEGAGFTLPRNAGGKQTLKSDQIEFVGYGAALPALKVDDYADRNVAGKVVVFLGPRGPKGGETPENRRLLGGRS